MISDEQWAAVAADLHVSVERLQAKIAELDASGRSSSEGRYDRDLDPITFGQWAYLYESRSYRKICETILPDHWIATIWRGIDVDLATRAERDHPLVMETAVFSTSGGRTQEVLRVTHASLDDARAEHDRLVARAITGDLPRRTSPSSSQGRGMSPRRR